MSWADLLTYRPWHFLLFSVEAYRALFEEGNAPVHVALALAGGCIALALTARSAVMPAPVAARAALGLTAIGWAVLAADFMAVRYAAINWAAPTLVPVVAAQALLLAVIAVTGRGVAGPGSGLGARESVAVGLAAYAVVLHPLLPLVTGRPPVEAEIVALAPLPTAILTLGVVAATLGGSLRRLALVVPVALLVIEAAVLATLGLPTAAVPLVALAVMPWGVGSTRRSAGNGEP
jgi:hypothetical protein